LPDLKLTEVVGGLDLPTQMVPFVGDERLLVLEQEGLIVAVRGGEGQVEPFADLTDRVHTRLPEYSEWGLLGLAFHPDFERNGRVFIHYSSVELSSALVGGETLSIAAGDGVISEFSVNADGLLDTDSEQRLLVVPQPELNHNGGGLEFSPMDGHLYIGLGDGGGQGNPNGNAQDLSSLLGKMLRIDVDSGVPYSIPEGWGQGACCCTHCRDGWRRPVPTLPNPE
jgi:glucose/arabinose dehydrogenase